MLELALIVTLTTLGQMAPEEVPDMISGDMLPMAPPEMVDSFEPSNEDARFFIPLYPDMFDPITGGINPEYATGTADQTPVPYRPEYNPQADYRKSINMQREIYLSWGILGFGTVVIFIITTLLIKSKDYWNNTGFKLLTIVICLSLGGFFITSGYSKDQINILMPILSSIIGYAFGNRESNPVPVKKDD